MCTLLGMGALLGGEASPIGWSVQFLEAQVEDVLEEIVAARAGWNRVIEVATPRPFPKALQDLLPEEAPWTRELVAQCGRWTAYLNNGLNGGDSTAIGPAIRSRLGVRLLVAEHTPQYGPGHQATQLWVLGPDGVPPLMYRRTISAYSSDGRWSWLDTGSAFDFEDLERYRYRRIRDRFDRDLLVEYLNHFGIDVDDNSAYGQATLIQEHPKKWSQAELARDRAGVDPGRTPNRERR